MIDERRGIYQVSPREREVLALVAEGRSNMAIAESLFVSANTVKSHVTSLLRKLDACNRAQLAAIAARQGVHLHDAALVTAAEALRAPHPQRIQG